MPPLYVVLLDEYARWTGDRKLAREFEYEARAALNWIDEYADLIGNGYVTYQRRNENDAKMRGAPGKSGRTQPSPTSWRSKQPT